MKKEEKLKFLSNHLIKNNFIINNDDEEKEKLKEQDYLDYIHNNFEKYIENMILKLFKKNILEEIEEIDDNEILNNIDENTNLETENNIINFKNKIIDMRKI